MSPRLFKKSTWLPGRGTYSTPSGFMPPPPLGPPGHSLSGLSEDIDSFLKDELNE